MIRLKVVLSVAFILICLPFALGCEAASFGKIAKELSQPAGYIAKLIHGICFATGIGLIISAIIKYMEYRRHHHIRFSLIFFLLLTGLALIGIGFLPMPTSGR